ncbi:hypothetical protein [Lactovum odontotermitis]
MFHTRTRIYKFIGGLLLVIGVAFSLGGFILSHHQEVVSTKVGTKIQNGTESLVFEKANYYQESNLLEVELIYNGSFNNANEQLQITAFDAAAKSKISARLEQINLNYYVVFVPNLSPFKQVLIEFTTRTINAKDKQDLKTISLTPENCQMKGRFTARTAGYYEQHYVSALSEETTKTINKIEQQTIKLQAQIVQFQDANQQLNTQLSYQTKEEQEKTKSEIGNNETQIDMLKEQIRDKETQKEKLEEKLKLLKSK